MLEDKGKASLNGFHSKYTDSVYGSEKRERERGSKCLVGLTLRFAADVNSCRWTLWIKL